MNLISLKSSLKSFLSPKPAQNPSPDLDLSNTDRRRKIAFDSNPFFAQLEPGFAARVLALFDAGTEVHKGDAIDVSSEAPALHLLGAFCTVLVSWRAQPCNASGVVTTGDVIGAGSAPYLPPGTPDSATMHCAVVIAPVGLVYSAPHTTIAAMLQGPDGPALRELLDALARSAWMSACSSLASTLSPLRAKLAMRMSQHVAEPGEVIVEHGQAEKAMYLIAPYGRVHLDQRAKDGTALAAFDMGFGNTFISGVFAITGATTRVVAVARTSYCKLPMQTFGADEKTDPLAVEFRRLTKQLQEILNEAEFIVRSLAQDPLFLEVPLEKLYLLLQAAWIVPWGATLPAPSPIGDIPGVSVVLSGVVYSYRQRAPRHQAALTATGPIFETLESYGPGRVFGQRSAIESDPLISHWRARREARVAFINVQRITDVFATNPEVQRNPDGPAPTYHPAHQAQDAWDHNVAQGRQRFAESAELVGLQALHLPALIMVSRNDDHPWVPGLTLLVALALGRGVRVFRERSIIISWGAHASRPQSTGNVWFWTEVAPPASDWLVFLTRLSKAGLKAEASNIVLLPPPDSSGESDLYTSALSRWVHVNVTGERPHREHWSMGVSQVHAYFLEGTRPKFQGIAEPFPLDTVRIDAKFAQLESLAATHLPDDAKRAELLDRQMGDPEFGSLLRSADRLSRSITHRRVGLSLSGGESWGFAHVPFLHALEYAQVPIDMVAGASFGAVVGTCYCVGGLPMTDKFSTQISKMGWMLAVSAVTSVVFEGWLNKFWGGKLLEELTIPCAPVSTNMERSSPEALLVGSAAAACRKSGSFTPLYPSTPTADATYLDGAFSANLPVDVLAPEDMRLIIASNVMSSNNGVTQPPRYPGRRGQVLSDINPLRRVKTAYEGVLSLAYANGMQSSRGAARTFQAVRTDTSLVNVNDAAVMEQLALSQPALWQTVLGVRAHLDAMPLG